MYLSTIYQKYIPSFYNDVAIPATEGITFRRKSVSTWSDVTHVISNEMQRSQLASFSKRAFKMVSKFEISEYNNGLRK